MKSNPRACIAYIAASLSGVVASSVFDYSQSKHISIGGTIDSSRANIYDYDRNCHIQGSINSLYDFGNNAHIQLTVNGTQFKGFDFHTNSHFSGTVTGRSVSIFDYETSSHYNYSI
jgi:hypothetical protein